MDTKTLAKPMEFAEAGSSTATALDGSPLPDVVEYIKEGKVDLVINIPEVRCCALAHVYTFASSK